MGSKLKSSAHLFMQPIKSDGAKVKTWLSDGRAVRCIHAVIKAIIMLTNNSASLIVGLDSPPLTPHKSLDILSFGEGVFDAIM